MRLKSKRVLELMEQRGITEDMLHDICGVHYVRDNRMISQGHAKRLSEVLGVDVPEIAVQLEREEKHNGRIEQIRAGSNIRIQCGRGYSGTLHG